MSDEEYERFEITDYDLENEFNPNRQRRKITKHQAIYGIWADESEGEERKSRKGRSGFASTSKGGRYKDYSAPVSFVAGGVQKSEKEKERPEEGSNDEKSAITDEEDEEETSRDFGSGKASKDVASNSRVHEDSSATNSSDDSMEDGSSSAKKKSKSTCFKQNRNTLFDTQPQSAGASTLNMGAWEQHTRGIGAKLLLRMGYEPGKGLGKDLQGRAQPVEAHVRKGRGAIGAYGPEVKSTPGSLTSKPGAEDLDSKDKTQKWRKSEKNYGSNDGRGDKSESKKHYYKSVEEVIEKGKKAPFTITDSKSKHLSNVPVIDMTGPEKRILSGYHALCQSRVQEEDEYYESCSESALKKSSANAGKVGFELPELMHNLNLIVDLCEQDIIALDSSEHAAKDRQVALEQEKFKLEQIVKLEQNHIRTLEEILKLTDELVAENSDLTLERAESIFHLLQTTYVAEYQEFGLGDLAASVIAPLFKNHLENWNPLQEPTLYVELVKKWRMILQRFDKDSEAAPRSNIFDPYSALIWAGVMPSFRSCVGHWKPKQHEPMAALMDCWAPLLPSWILDSILEQLILPRLTEAVGAWDPLTDTVPIHAWVLPWNIILGNKMEQTIYPTIRDKLGKALQNWLPQDRSALAMLLPWKAAFNPKAMEVFLGLHIAPKLQATLDELIINPLHQNLELWNQVWEWNVLLTTTQMGRLLDKHFFPKWMQVLVLWLNQTPNFVEILNWYTGWKNMLTEAVQNETNVKEHLRRALEIMHRATDTVLPSANIGVMGGMGMGGVPPSSSIPTMPNLTSVPPPPPPPPVGIPPPTPLMDIQIPPPPQLEFKDLVSRKCAEKGILFAPMPGRRELGKQIYRVGKLYCYIDRNVCMYSDGNLTNWAPISLQSMVEQAS